MGTTINHAATLRSLPQSLSCAQTGLHRGRQTLSLPRRTPSTASDCSVGHHLFFFLRPARLPAQWALCENPFGLAQLMRRLYASLHAMAVTGHPDALMVLP